MVERKKERNQKKSRRNMEVIREEGKNGKS